MTPKNEPKTQEAKDEKIEMIKHLTPAGQSPKVYFKLIKDSILGTDKEGKERPFEDLTYFLYVANRTKLDPMARQIYAIYRWDARIQKEKMTIQTSIDGMRVIAERSGKYAGQDDIEYKELDGQTFPVAATATVHKINPINGVTVATKATARWSEFVQKTKDGKPMGLWGSMPYNQLGKCAEALALRKAFPNELSGIYSEEEMQQADNTKPVELANPENETKPATEGQLNILKQVMGVEELPKDMENLTFSQAREKIVTLTT